MRVVETNSTLKALQFGVGSNCRRDKEATSLGSQATSKDIDWNVAPAGRMKKRYSIIMIDRPGNVPFDKMDKLLSLIIMKVQNTPGLYSSQK